MRAGDLKHKINNKWPYFKMKLGPFVETRVNSWLKVLT